MLISSYNGIYLSMRLTFLMSVDVSAILGFNLASKILLFYIGEMLTTSTSSPSNDPWVVIGPILILIMESASLFLSSSYFMSSKLFYPFKLKLLYLRTPLWPTSGGESIISGEARVFENGWWKVLFYYAFNVLFLPST